MTRRCYGMYAALVVLLGGATVLASPIATLTLQSQPGDVIGQGGNYDITYPGTNGDPLGASIMGFVTGLPALVDFGMGSLTPAANTLAFLSFSTYALGIPMQPGTYTNAQRDSSSPGPPGLQVSFQNRGCNTITGSFVVTDFSFVGPPLKETITSFSASFEQHCDGETPALFGTFTYNANGATPIPEPAGYWLVGVGLTGVTVLAARRRLGMTGFCGLPESDFPTKPATARTSSSQFSFPFVPT